MPTFFHKPENALKRAHEFMEVGKEDSALEVLNDVIRSRKHRHKWTSDHEKIMLLYTRLCVRLQRSSYAKDGLYQYRNICKEVAPNSFEKVINSFLKLAEDTAETARQQSEATVLQEVEDLDAVLTPESLLLSTVSGEGAKERTDRVLLTPWVKFLWESYRNMLELLKNNQTNLTVYTDVAKKAFAFCLNYQRRMEYRKLCDILRNHLSQAEKYQQQSHSLKLDQPEVIQCLVDVRFKQLESSIAVDLWQEAFRAIEEIHKLLSMLGKAPKPSLLENFYSRQAKVYMMAKNQLFHAAALHQLFVLRKEQKKTLTPEEAQITASQVLLATLSVPIEPVPSETDRFLEVDDNSRDKARRLAALLRMTTPPTRATLMRDMLHHNVLQLVSPELQQLYQYLEVDFNPLHLCHSVLPILDSLEEQENFKQYVELLKGITLVRLIKQVSQVYETIELSHLVELAPFTTTTELEKVVVETATSNNIQVRIDHRTKSLCFGTDLNFSYKAESPEGPHVQNMPSEILCNQLIIMAQALQQAVRIVAASEQEAEQQAAAKRACQGYQVHARGDHRRAMQRGGDIEARKEFIESQRRDMEKQKEDSLREKQKREREEEEQRLIREAKQREKDKKQKELEEMQLKIKKEKLDALKNTAVGKRAFADITNEDLKHMDADVIFSKQLKQIEKEKRDKEIKLKAQEKKVDYFERAKRMEELELLKQQYERQKGADREFHEDQEEQKVSSAIREREEAVEASARLKVMREDAAKFRGELQERRRLKHSEELEKFKEKLAIVRAERLAKRKEQRKERRKAEAEIARKEEEVRQAQLKRDEEARKLEEERKKREAEREEELQKQRKRDAEIEEKMKQRELQAMEEMKKERERYNRGPPANEAGSWRERDNREEVEAGYGRQGGGGGGAYRPPIGRGGPRGDVGGSSPRRERRGMGGDEDSWRGDEREGWRGGRQEEDRRPPKREGWREEPRDRDGWRGEGRGGEEEWRRGGDDGDEETRKEESWRSEGGGGSRDRGDDWRVGGGGGGGGGRGPPFRRAEGGGRGYDSPRSRRDDRWGDDRDRGPRDFRGRDRDEKRPPPRDYDRGGERWGRGYGDRDDRGGGDRWRRDDRGGRDDDRGGGDRWRRDNRGDRDGDRGGGERWRRDDRGDRDDDRGGGDKWRRDRDRDDGGKWGRGDRGDGDGDRWTGGGRERDRDDGRGRWGEDRGGRDGGRLRVEKGWRNTDRSPGREDKGRGISPRRQLDEDGFETVNRRR